MRPNKRLKQRWHLMQDNDPLIAGQYLTYCAEFGLRIDIWQEEQQDWESCLGKYYTHWMECPELPEE